MIYRIFVEKKPHLANEAKALLTEARSFLGIMALESVRIINRYDAENIDKELFDYAVKTVFSEPQQDDVYEKLDFEPKNAFAVEFLPGQFDQRADSASQCIQLISQKERPTVKTAKIYILEGDLTEEEKQQIKKYVINPVEARETGFEKPETLETKYYIPTEVETLHGFSALDEEGLKAFSEENSLAMDTADLCMCRDYFAAEKRDPTITEIKMIDTYWSDHCRHTTFNTVIDKVSFEDELLQNTYEEYIKTREALGVKKPVSLMDMATVAVKQLKKEGRLEKLDESEEINACTVNINVEIDGKEEDWLLLFKNETHNHPTEIEPFGGAATCIGGAIRDPLSGRAYVYGAMRVTGAADPLKPVSETLPGKLPQRKIVSTAAAGYSSYGNQIGISTGIVDEVYHPGYEAKRMEIGAVIAAAPKANVVRERPLPGDVVILLGGSTGRDGCGGATGSSKSHTAQSLESCGAEVQKGNAPEERKLQRLFRNGEACRMIKRCNDFGAGGVSVAIGELADGLLINLDAVPKKYEGLDGTELAISESQERMAVVVAKENEKKFMQLAEEENLQAVNVAKVTEEPRLTMLWNGNKIVDIKREFLDTNGAAKHIRVKTSLAKYTPEKFKSGFAENYKKIMGDLNVCSKRGLAERFDSTIGAGSVLMPFGGKYQMTPVQAMVQKIPLLKGETDDCSLMAFGFDPYVSEQSPYHGAYLSVVESVSKLVATGAEFKDVYLTFQEYFEHLGKDELRWGKPLSALLGAFKAQKELGVGAIGGKDSMSGSFENLNVPPTLVSFAVTMQKTRDIISPEFKACGHEVRIFVPEYDENFLPKTESLLKTFETVTKLIRGGKIVSCYTPCMGGVAEAVAKMCMGNRFGFEFDGNISDEKVFSRVFGAFVCEMNESVSEGILLGKTLSEAEIRKNGERISLEEISEIYESKLESVYPCNVNSKEESMEAFKNDEKCSFGAYVKKAKPKVLIPVFPGTNCEYDSAKAVEKAGCEAEIFVINNLSADNIARSTDDFAKKIEESQIIFIPGGFSGGDEPDGSGKFITAFFRNEQIKKQTMQLLDDREGLILGICNGFQALIKLGLVPYGKIIETDANCPTLTYNTIARHQSKIVRTKVVSAKSPWLALTERGEVYNVPISHGEGCFIADEALIRQLCENGQIATQYVDLDGNASMNVEFNPNGSKCAIEGITSPDGRVLGKMGHNERISAGLYKNVTGNYDMRLFEAAAKYFK